jgi:hypothetical protein
VVKGRMVEERNDMQSFRDVFHQEPSKFNKNQRQKKIEENFHQRESNQGPSAYHSIVLTI